MSELTARERETIVSALRHLGGHHDHRAWVINNEMGDPRAEEERSKFCRDLAARLEGKDSA